MDKKTLFSKDAKDRIRVWSIWTDGATIFMESGLKDGKMKQESREAKPKNVGRANETTAEEQAVLEAESRVKKQRDKGYFDTEEEAQTTLVVLPMLAHPYKKRKKSAKFPGKAQPKLDGTRCLAIISGGTVRLVTRKGKSYPNLAHIEDALLPIASLGQDIAIDGEAYCHGELPFERLAGLVRKETLTTDDWVDIKKIGLRAYDMYIPAKPDLGFDLRWARLENTVRFLGEGVPVTLVETIDVGSEEEFFEACKGWVADGYEGGMFRNADGAYGLNKRSADLLKHKQFEDDEFEIVGYREATGKDAETVIWTCKTTSGATFDVRPRGSHEQRSKWFRDGDLYIGEMLTVRYQELTQDGIPRFPVGIAVRDYE